MGYHILLVFLPFFKINFFILITIIQGLGTLNSAMVTSLLVYISVTMNIGNTNINSAFSGLIMCFHMDLEWVGLLLVHMVLSLPFLQTCTITCQKTVIMKIKIYGDHRCGGFPLDLCWVET